MKNYKWLRGKYKTKSKLVVVCFVKHGNVTNQQILHLNRFFFYKLAYLFSISLLHANVYSDKKDDFLFFKVIDVTPRFHLRMCKKVSQLKIHSFLWEC